MGNTWLGDEYAPKDIGHIEIAGYYDVEGEWIVADDANQPDPVEYQDSEKVVVAISFTGNDEIFYRTFIGPFSEDYGIPEMVDAYLEYDY